MEDGQTDVVLLWEARAMSEQNVLVSARSAPASSTPAPNTPPLRTVHLFENGETLIRLHCKRLVSCHILSICISSEAVE
jgi:hypothetical protein